MKSIPILKEHSLPAVAPLPAPGGVKKPYAPLPLVIAAFAAVYVVWGSTYLGITIAIRSIPPFLMAGSRFILAGALLYAVMRWRGARKPTLAQWGAAAIIGSLLLAAGNGGVTWAQRTVPTGISALIVASVPLWIMAVDWIRPGGRRPAPLIVAGLIAGFVGVTVIILSKNSLGQRMVDPTGALILIGSSFCWAVGSVYARHAPKPESALLTVSLQMLAGGAVQCLLGLGMGELGQLNFSTITSESAWAFLYLTFVGSLVGYTAYAWLLQVSTPALVSTYAYVNPLVAVLLGHLVLNENVPSSVAIAGLLILTAVVLITRATTSRVPVKA